VPADFNNAQLLFNTEMAVILKKTIDERRDAGEQPGEHLRAMYEHVARFDLMKGEAARVANVRHAMQTHEFEALHDFEVTQIVNLGCEDDEEAKALVPSLRRKIEHGGADSLLDTDRLRSVIDQVTAQRALG
jgi:hypothetical protein